MANVTTDAKKICEYIYSHENILKGKQGFLQNADGSRPRIDSWHKRYREESSLFLQRITEAPRSMVVDNETKTIDILSSDFTLQYTIGEEPITVESLVLTGSANAAYADYALSGFDVYFSDNNDGELFESKNLMYSYKKTREFKAGVLYQGDVMITFDKPITALRFGIKVSEPNPTDDISRIMYLGLYSAQNDLEAGVLKKYTGKNLANEAFLQDDKGERVLEFAELFDGRAFGKRGITLNGETLKFTPRQYIETGSVFLAVEGDPSALEFTCGTSGETEIITIAENKYIVKKAFSGDCCSVTSGAPLFITEAGVCKGERKALVSTSQTVCNDFYGFGGNVVPSMLMEESLNDGYNEAYFEEEKRRNMLIRANVVRVWFQPDWFIKDEQSYLKGDYDFNTAEMKAVYKVFQSFKAAGTDIEFNFGWKVGEHVFDWYCLDVDQKKNSAPKDIKNFAKSLVAVLKHLFAMGFDNIKYLTFYNEPNCGDFMVEKQDRIKYGGLDLKKADYWLLMARTSKDALKENGLADKIEMWGPETSGGDTAKISWAEYFERKDPGLLDVHTVHKYWLKTEDAEYFADNSLVSTHGKPLVVTEFNTQKTMAQWNYSITSIMFDYINRGISGALIWMLSGARIPMVNSFVCTADSDLWHFLPNSPTLANLPFAVFGLITPYVSSHSKVLLSKTAESDLRIAAFSSENNLTILVEADSCHDNRELEIHFDTAIEKTFNKFIIDCGEYKKTEPYLQQKCGEVFVSGDLRDTLPKGHTLTMYTTAKPIAQVKADRKLIKLKPGESTAVGGSFVNFTSKEKLTAEIAVGSDIITLCGNTVTCSENAKAGQMAAIKLKTENRTDVMYDIVLIEVE